MTTIYNNQTMNPTSFNPETKPAQAEGNEALGIKKWGVPNKKATHPKKQRFCLGTDLIVSQQAFSSLTSKRKPSNFETPDAKNRKLTLFEGLNKTALSIKNELSRELLVSPKKLEEKKDHLSQYIEKKQNKYGHVLETAREDYKQISQNYTVFGDHNLLKSKNNEGLYINNELLMKIIRQSNLLLNKAGGQTNTPISFTPKKGPGVIASRDNGQLSLLIWSGKTKIKSTSPLCLGKGGFGAVHKVRDVSNGVFVALKVAKSSEGNSSIQNEFNVLNKIHKDEIIPGLQLPPNNLVRLKNESDEEILGITQRLYNMGDLRNAIFSKGNNSFEIDAYPLEERLKMLTSLLQGLKTLHDKNIIHGDIKQHNCFVDLDKNNHIQFFLADLGDAKQKNSDLIMHANSPLGTVNTNGFFTIGDYLGLKKFAKKNDYDSWYQANTKRDIFAMAMTLWFAVTGTAPFSRTSNSDFPFCTSKIFEIDTVKGLIGDGPTDILIKALSEDPNERPTLEEMIDAFSS